MSGKLKQRLSYVDWMRGLACLAMFQTHCYDAWLSDSARQSGFFKWSQLVGTLPTLLRSLFFWRELENQLALAGQTHFFAGDALDEMRVGLQRLNFFGKLLIVRSELRDFLAQLFHFLLLAAHDQEAVLAKEHVRHQRHEQQHKDGPAPALQKSLLRP